MWAPQVFSSSVITSKLSSPPTAMVMTLPILSSGMNWYWRISRSAKNFMASSLM
jgi:hypothetical protein